jgi:hypothetical protein
VYIWQRVVLFCFVSVFGVVVVARVGYSYYYYTYIAESSTILLLGKHTLAQPSVDKKTAATGIAGFGMSFH